MKKRPNFLVIGAMKAGTTAFHNFLNQHPDIFMSKTKEPRYFALKNDDTQYSGPNDPAARFNFKEMNSYLDLFENVKEEKVIGESSTLYLYHPQAARNIHEFDPKMKLIAILRNPVDRAYSNYIYTRRDSREDQLTFKNAIDLESKRIEENWGPLWHYKKRGLYYEQLVRYLEFFSKEQIHIILYDDYRKNPELELKKAFEFLEVDPGYNIEIEKEYNVSGLPSNIWVNKLLNIKSGRIKELSSIIPKFLKKDIKERINQVNIKKAPKLSQEEKMDIYPYYKEEIEKLEGLIDVDLNKWKIQ